MSTKPDPGKVAETLPIKSLDLKNDVVLDYMVFNKEVLNAPPNLNQRRIVTVTAKPPYMNAAPSKK